MTRQWIAALTLVLVAGLSACQTKPVQKPDDAIRFAVDSAPFPPFTMQDGSGKWTGFEIDLMDAVCAEMKAKCTVVPTPWNALIADLEAGRIDVIWSSMTITKAREAVIDFSAPYYATHSVLVAARATKVNPDQPQTLGRKRIAVFPAQEAYARQHFNSAAAIVPVDPESHGGALDAIMADAQADAIFLDQFIADAFLTSNHGGALSVQWTAPLDPALLSPVAAGLRKSDQDLRAKLNAALQAVYASGRFKEINARYFAYDISAR